MSTLSQAKFDEDRRRSRRVMLSDRNLGLSSMQDVINVLGMSWHLSSNPHSMDE